MKQLIMAMVFGLMMALGMKRAEAQTVQVPQKQASEWRGSIDSYYRTTTWDIDLQGGVGYVMDTTSKTNNFTLGFVRARAGVLTVPTYPWIIAFGPTFELNNFGATYPSPGAAFGAQIELTNFGIGWWARVGPSLDTSSRPSIAGAVGWSFFGVEARYTGNWGYIDPVHNESYAVLGTVRLPIGVIAYALSRK